MHFQKSYMPSSLLNYMLLDHWHTFFKKKTINMLVNCHLALMLMIRYIYLFIENSLRIRLKSSKIYFSLCSFSQCHLETHVHIMVKPGLFPLVASLILFYTNDTFNKINQFMRYIITECLLPFLTAQHVLS